MPHARDLFCRFILFSLTLLSISLLFGKYGPNLHHTRPQPKHASSRKLLYQDFVGFCISFLIRQLPISSCVCFQSRTYLVVDTQQMSGGRRPNKNECARYLTIQTVYEKPSHILTASCTFTYSPALQRLHVLSRNR